MMINTKDYGILDINEEDIISFPKGVYAFEESKSFVIINSGNKSGFMQLQSIENENPRFIILPAENIIKDYNPDIPEDMIKILKADTADDLCFFVIAVIPSNVKASTVNLRSPIAVNFKERLGAQVILENGEYPVRFKLFENERA
ncbi:MAG: flagellar assembly protein FliW [Oscillospiraceae bacterium]|nr:flagellar assembly protein FliW [Oscillospiraceae bacterium]